MDDTETKRPHPLLLPLFGGEFCDWEETDRSMREIMGNEAWDDALAQWELDMQDATVAAPAGPTGNSGTKFGDVFTTS